MFESTAAAPKQSNPIPPNGPKRRVPPTALSIKNAVNVYTERVNPARLKELHRAGGSLWIPASHPPHQEFRDGSLYILLPRRTEEECIRWGAAAGAVVRGHWQVDPESITSLPNVMKLFLIRVATHDGERGSINSDLLAALTEAGGRLDIRDERHPCKNRNVILILPTRLSAEQSVFWGTCGPQIINGASGIDPTGIQTVSGKVKVPLLF